VVDQRRAPAAVKRPGRVDPVHIVQEAGLTLGADLDGWGSLAPHSDSIPGSGSPQRGFENVRLEISGCNLRSRLLVLCAARSQCGSFSALETQSYCFVDACQTPSSG
jgi:hypothetical protein